MAGDRAPNTAPGKEPEWLPFLVNETLEGAELEQAWSYLEHSEGAREEVAFLHWLRSELLRPTEEPGLSASERERILKSVEGEQSEADVRSGPPRGFRPGSWALAAAVLIATLEAGALTGLLYRGSGALLTPARFEPAGAPSAAQLSVQFRDDSSSGAIRELLLERGLAIVEGPSAAGVYGLVLLDDAEQHQLDAALAALREREDLVDYAGLR